MAAGMLRYRWRLDHCAKRSKLCGVSACRASINMGGVSEVVDLSRKPADAVGENQCRTGDTYLNRE